MLKKVIKFFLPKRIREKVIFIKNNYFDGYAKKCYSQEGEDFVLERIFGDKKKGFYVDVGAHHPKRFSNTYYFYKKGWRGINIDAMPGSMKFFNKFRSRDINIEIPISDKKESLTYYIFNEPALNTFDKKLAMARDKKNGYRIIKEIKMQTYTLEEVFEKYLPSEMSIDFLTIDVEGLDFNVLKSNNWTKYRAKVILVEILGSSLSNILNHPIARYMEELNYEVFAKTVNTVFFIDENYKKQRLG